MGFFHAGTGREPSTSSSSPTEDMSDIEPSHRGCHKFIPRHAEEMFIEIGDPLYVEEECEDLWCEGMVVFLQISCTDQPPGDHIIMLSLESL